MTNTTTTIPMLDLGLWTNVQWYPVLTEQQLKYLLANREPELPDCKEDETL